MLGFLKGLFGGGGSKITVQSVKSPAWQNLEASLKKSGELKSLNFENLGYFLIPERPHITSMACYVNLQESCYALVYETVEFGVILEIYCEYLDGREVVFTTEPAKPGAKVPAYMIKEHRPETETRAVFADLLKMRPPGDLKPVSAQGFPADYQKSQAKSPGFKPATPKPAQTAPPPGAPPAVPAHPLEGSTVEMVQLTPVEGVEAGADGSACCCIDFMITPPGETASWEAAHLSLFRSDANVPCQITAIQVHDGENFQNNVGTLSGARYVRMFAMIHPETAQLQLRYNTHTLLTLDVAGSPEQAAG
jgi:hypothetical protein